MARICIVEDEEKIRTELAVFWKGMDTSVFVQNPLKMCQVISNPVNLIWYFWI